MKIIITVRPGVDLSQVHLPGEAVVDPDSRTITYPEAASFREDVDGFYCVDGEQVVPRALVEKVDAP